MLILTKCCAKSCSNSLKGHSVTRFFCFRFFSWIIFPQVPENNIKVISNFCENSRRYSQLKVHHRYQRHQWKIWPPVPLVLLIPVCHRCQRYRQQICPWCRWHRWRIMGIISDCWHLKVNLKQKCELYYHKVSKQNKKDFAGWRFFTYAPVSMTPVVQFSCEYLRKFLKTFETALMVYSGAWGKLIHEKNLTSKKISWHCPFNVVKSVHHDLGSGLNPASGVYRILFVTWWIFISFLTAVYTAQLTAVLTRATK
jgi:hypothetical protein